MLAFVVKAGSVWLCVVLTETIWATTVSTCQDVQQMSSSESTQLLRELQWRQVFTSQTKYLFQHIVEHQHTKSPSPTHTPALQPLLSLSLHSSSSPWLIFSVVIFNSYCRGNICFIIFMCLLPKEHLDLRSGHLDIVSKIVIQRWYQTCDIDHYQRKSRPTAALSLRCIYVAKTF